MQRVLSVWFPYWSVELAWKRRRTESQERAPQSILVVREEAGRTLVVARSPFAAERGVSVGMPLSEARALLAPDEPLVDARSDLVESAALEALALWSMRFSPGIALDPPDGLLIDVDGVARLYRSERRFLHSVGRSFERIGLHARLAAAPSAGAAWALARYASSELVQVAHEHVRASLEPLPVECLRVPPATLEKLHGVGITTIAELVRLPRAKLPARFGEELLLRLDQLEGRVLEPLEFVEWKPALCLERAFDGLVSSLEVLHLATRELIHELARPLEQQGTGIHQLVLTIYPSDLPPTSISVQSSRPTTDERGLFELLEPKLDATNLGFGVERIELEAVKTGKLREHQSAAWSRSDVTLDRNFSDLLDTLMNRFPPQRIQKRSARESHVPEQAFVAAPYAASSLRVVTKEHSAVTPFDRPSLLFEQPVCVRLERAAGRRTELRGLGGSFTVIDVAGPERICAPWWGTERGFDRDYYRVETQCGRLFWIFQEIESSKWFMHGEWA